MKTKNRIHRQNNTRRNSSQAEPRTRAARRGRGEQPRSTPQQEGLPPFDAAIDHPSCLCLFDRAAGSPVSQVPLTPDEFCSLICHAAGPGGAEQFIAEAVREKLASTDPRGQLPETPSARRGPGTPQLHMALSDDEIMHLTTLIENVKSQVSAQRAFIRSLFNLLECEGKPSAAAVDDYFRLWWRLGTAGDQDSLENYWQNLRRAKPGATGYFSRAPVATVGRAAA